MDKPRALLGRANAPIENVMGAPVGCPIDAGTNAIAGRRQRNDRKVVSPSVLGAQI
jgi:hypothetical protein